MLKPVAVKIYNGKTQALIHSVSHLFIYVLVLSDHYIIYYIMQLYFLWFLCMFTFPYWKIAF